MFERFTEDARRAVLAAMEEAAELRGDPRLGSEHLLLGVVTVGEPVAQSFELTLDRLRSQLDRLDSRALRSVGIDADLAQAPLGPTFGRRRHLPFTRGAKQSLQRSLNICLAEGHREIRTTHMLAGLVWGGAHDPAIRLLRGLGVEPAELDAAIRRHWLAA